ncbi:hypothetical protein HMPREF2835_03810 [Actinomyces sp. HMSC072A03]|nr:hypothetical protein HMPREF2835_03810 [Actinomyces sp. HMSC072A03]
MLREDYTASDLEELAHKQPHLWPQILHHPACSNELRTWIGERSSRTRNQAKTHVRSGLVVGVGSILFALMVAAMTL